MKHDYMNVTYKDRDYISHLVLESLLEELRYQGQFAVAQGITTEDGENEIIGAATFFVDVNSKNDTVMNVRWFYIQPKYRGQGHGRALYNQICSLAVENKVKVMKMSFPDIEDTEGFNYLFYEMDYDFTKEGIVEIYTNLGEVADQTTIVGKLAKHNATMPLSETTDFMVKKFVNSLSFDRRHASDYILPADVAGYEADLSFVELDKNGDIDAALLVRHVNDALEPILFYTKDDKNLIALFRVLGNCLIAAEKKYGRDKSVRLRSTTFTKWEKINKLLPHVKYIPVIHGSMELDPVEDGDF